MVSSVLGLLLCHGEAQAHDVQTIYQGIIRGGVSVDATGVAVGPDNIRYFGPDLVVEIPASATVEHVYALLTSRGSGFRAHTDLGVRINGVVLARATFLGEVDEPENRLRFYELPDSWFHIDRAGTYTYSETLAAENQVVEPGFGVLGTTLVVVYADDVNYGRRHVSVFGTLIWLGTETFTGLPTNQVTDSAVMSLTMGFEPWFDQWNTLYVDGNYLTNLAGGADDGDLPEGYTRPLPNSDSQITAGSFGFDDDGLLVGTDGDDADSEPADGTNNNSRRSDELYRVAHDSSGSMLFDLRATENMMDDQWITSVVLSIEVDTDEDGIEDATDSDIDADGLMNAAEQLLGSDVYRSDTDGDGVDDGAEVANGTDPLAP